MVLHLLTYLRPMFTYDDLTMTSQANNDLPSCMHAGDYGAPHRLPLLYFTPTPPALKYNPTP